MGFASDFIVSLASGVAFYVCSETDAGRAFGAGMTIKFFPLFFQKDCQMTPAQVMYTPASCASSDSYLAPFVLPYNC